MADTPTGDGRGEKTAVISLGCDAGSVVKGGDIDDVSVVVKQEASAPSEVVVLDGGLHGAGGKKAQESRDPVHFVEQEKEVLVLTLNKKEDPDGTEQQAEQSKASGLSQNTEGGLHKKLKSLESGETQSTPAEIPPRKRAKTDGCKPSLQEVISNLSQGASLLRDLANTAGAHLSHSAVSASSIPASLSSQPDGICTAKREKVEASKSDITQSSWFSLPSSEHAQKDDRKDGEEIYSRSINMTSSASMSLSCQQKSELLMSNQRANATPNAQLNTVGAPVRSAVSPVVAPPASQSPQQKPPPAHHKPSRRRARKTASSTKDSAGDGGSSSSSSGPASVSVPAASVGSLSGQQTAALGSVGSVGCTAIRGAAPAAVVSPQSMFSVPYSPILPAVYDYSLPDRGLSSATASILAAASGFPSPQPQATPFMMSYFPLQSMWGSAGTVAIAAAAAAAASVSLPTPLDLSSPSKEAASGRPPNTEPQEPLYLGKKDNSGNNSPAGSAGAQTPSSSSHPPSTKESSRAAKKSSHHKSSVKTGPPPVGVSESSSEKASHASPKGAGGLEKQVDTSSRRKESAANAGQKAGPGKDGSSASKSPSHQVSSRLPQDSSATPSSRARYEKNLLLFGDQEVEIMNVGKLRWVVRNETDLLRIAQANLRKWSAPACDSATVILEANSSTENSAGSVDRASDCPVSSSERREDGEQEDVGPALTVGQPVFQSAPAPGLSQQPAPRKPAVLSGSSLLGKREAEDQAVASPCKALKLSNGVEGSTAGKQPESDTEQSLAKVCTILPTPKTTNASGQQLTGLPNFLIDLCAVSEASNTTGKPASGISSASSVSMKASPLSSILLPVPGGGSDQLTSPPARQTVAGSEPSSLASLLSAPSTGPAQRATNPDAEIGTNASQTEEGSKPGDAPSLSPASPTPLTVLPVEADNSLNKEYSLLSNMLKSAH
ncbi:hypothetical protein EGW08_008911 [Elysia chlorotica]|uniref:Uncharacterized protein n=1 Tax=Elysia chlorotica TaxID=188477 RepID=A0A3S1BL62_ELYCH|nr:hypothetical protein EGW08_008911 [Elysia chlorotica]